MLQYLYLFIYLFNLFIAVLIITFHFILYITYFLLYIILYQVKKYIILSASYIDINTANSKHNYIFIRRYIW